MNSEMKDRPELYVNTVVCKIKFCSSYELNYCRVLFLILSNVCMCIDVWAVYAEHTLSSCHVALNSYCSRVIQYNKVHLCKDVTQVESATQQCVLGREDSPAPCFSRSAAVLMLLTGWTSGRSPISSDNTGTNKNPLYQVKVHFFLNFLILLTLYYIITHYYYHCNDYFWHFDDNSTTIKTLLGGSATFFWDLESAGQRDGCDGVLVD